MDIKRYEAMAGSNVGDALSEMYSRMLHGGTAVMNFNGVTIIMLGRYDEEGESVIREIREG